MSTALSEPIPPHTLMAEIQTMMGELTLADDGTPAGEQAPSVEKKDSAKPWESKKLVVQPLAGGGSNGSLPRPSVSRWGGESGNWKQASVYDLAPHINVADDPQAKAVFIRKCEVQAAVSASLARVTVTLTFANTSGRALEGEAVIPLPEDAVVSGYALEFNGAMVPASLVEAKKAEKVYEAEVKKGNQVAAMSKVSAGGNSFKTKVHPLPANGTRRLSITYTQVPEASAGTAAAGSSVVSFGGLGIAAVQRAKGNDAPVELSVEATITCHSATRRPQVDGPASAVLANSEANPFEYHVHYADDGSTSSSGGGGAIHVAIPDQDLDAGTASVSVQPAADGDGLYFLINDAAPASVSASSRSSTTSKGGRTCVIWDASLSRDEDDMATSEELAVLEKLLRSSSCTAVDVHIVRDAAEFHAAQSVDQALSLIKAAPLDGATNLQALARRLTAEYLSQFDRVLLFSDGQSSFGEGRIPALERDGDLLPPVFALSSASKVNKVQLENYWAGRTGGAFLRVSAKKEAQQQVVDQILATDLPRICSVRSQLLLGSAASACLNPSGPKTIAGQRFTITGHLPKAALASVDPLGTAAVYCSLSGGEVREYRVPVLCAFPSSSSSSTSATSDLVSVVWAQQRIAELEVFPERNGPKILELGRKHGIVTASSSLLILDTVEQHLEHDIEPHAARKDVYDEFHKQRTSEREDETSRLTAKCTSIVSLWRSEIQSWYESSFEIPKKKQSSLAPPPITANGPQLDDLSEPIRNLITKLDSSDDQAEAARIGGRATVRVMAKVFDMLSLEEDPDRILHWLRREDNKRDEDRSYRSAPHARHEDPIPAPPGEDDDGSSLPPPPPPEEEGITGEFVTELADTNFYVPHDRENTEDELRAEEAALEALEEEEMARPDEEAAYLSINNEDDCWEAYEGIEEVEACYDRAGTEAEEEQAWCTEEESSPVPLEQKGAKANTTVQYWNPSTPYLTKIRAAGAKKGDTAAQYQEYLRQRAAYFRTPAFYLDVGAFFLNPAELTEERRLLAIRVLSNIAELGLDNSRVLRVLGYKLYEAKEWALAREVFCRVATFRPAEPQSFRDLGLTFLESGWYQQAVNLLWRTCIMDVPSSFAQIELECLWEIRDALKRAERAGVAVVLPTLLKENYSALGLDKDMSLDLRITMGWDQDSVDIDLHIIEPTKEEAYYGNRSTKIGGRVSRDFTQGYGPESYVLKDASACGAKGKGVYKVKTHFYGSHQATLTGPTTAILTITTNFLRKNQKTECTLVRLQGEGNNGEIGQVTLK